MNGTLKVRKEKSLLHNFQMQLKAIALQNEK